jgi:hypothetical protein
MYVRRSFVTHHPDEYYSRTFILTVPAATTPKVRFDHRPLTWLKDPVFTAYRVQLKEKNGDGSILELIRTDIASSTVEVQPLLTLPPRRSMSLKDVRHVIACAPYQMVVAIAGDLKGKIMKMGTYGKEECTLYSASGRRPRWATHFERTYKTAHLRLFSRHASDRWPLRIFILSRLYDVYSHLSFLKNVLTAELTPPVCYLGGRFSTTGTLVS